MTQAEFAKRLGEPNPTQYQRYEGGHRPAPVPWLRKVEAKFGVTLDIRSDEQVTPVVLSPEQRQGVLIAARKLHALAQDLFELGMTEVTPLAPAAAQGVHAVLRGTVATSATRRRPKAG